MHFERAIVSVDLDWNVQVATKRAPEQYANLLSRSG